MADLPPIPTPLNQHWKRVRYQLVPVITMGLSLVAVAFLWSRHAGVRDTVGEVHMSSSTATALRDGILLRHPHTKLYDSVMRGAEIARLDDRETQNSLRALKMEVDHLATTMPREPADPAGKVAWQAAKLRLDILGATISVEASRLVRAGVKNEFKHARDFEMHKAADDEEPTSSADELKTQLDELDKSIDSQQAALKKMHDDLRQVRADLEKQQAQVPQAVASELLPIHNALFQHEGRLAELQKEAASLSITAPIDGKVIAINRHAGQSVQAGDAVMTVARDLGTEVIAYVRQDQPIALATNALVKVRSHTGGKSYDARVEKVGPALQPVPLHQLRNSKVEEWGVPVTISVGEQARFRPGELVDVKFVQPSQTP